MGHGSATARKDFGRLVVRPVMEDPMEDVHRRRREGPGAEEAAGDEIAAVPDPRLRTGTGPVPSSPLSRSKTVPDSMHGRRQHGRQDLRLLPPATSTMCRHCVKSKFSIRLLAKPCEPTTIRGIELAQLSPGLLPNGPKRIPRRRRDRGLLQCVPPRGGQPQALQVRVVHRHNRQAFSLLRMPFAPTGRQALC